MTETDERTVPTDTPTVGGDDPITVLHVEDDPATAGLVRTRFEERSRVDYLEADGPEAALDRLEESTVDCIVSDYEMPRTNGIELLQAVRRRSLDLPFVLYTGVGSEEIASAAIAEGVSGYVRKRPGVDHLDLLYEKVTTVVDKRRAERELERTRELFEHVETFTASGAWELDYRSDDLFVTSGVRRLLGLGPGEAFPPERAGEFLNGTDLAEVRGAIDSAIEDRAPHETLVRLTTTAGDRRWVRIVADPVSKGGEVAFLRGTIQDVTDRLGEGNLSPAVRRL